MEHRRREAERENSRESFSRIQKERTPKSCPDVLGRLFSHRADNFRNQAISQVSMRKIALTQG